MDIQTTYGRWLERADGSLHDALVALGADAGALEDAFYRDLSFGTAGLRGVIGPGTNRMNIHTVGRATQGLADYLNANFEEPTVAICRDSRRMGEEFAKVAAGVLAANGIRSFVYPRIEPTPALSFAVRDLGCSAGINVTASHNPAEYNGYKVYGPDGCQITSEAATAIQKAIGGVDVFDGVKCVDFDEALASSMASWIGEDTLDRFIDAVAARSLDADGAGRGELKVVYTPLNGTGLECVKRILARIGVTDITVVPEQSEPDGDFPTCAYPNPESRAALERGLALCDVVKPDILLATDPDADRVGIAVPHEGEYVLLDGNEIGVLLIDYVCRMRAARGEDLSRAVVLTTIVSTTMVDALAEAFGFQLRRTLTGFKYLGEQIGLLEAKGEEDRFIFGFEESYGYMSGSHVRDKDAVNACMLICEMARWHRAQGRDLVDAMEGLYVEHGQYLSKTLNFAYPGAEGAARMASIMEQLHDSPLSEVAGLPVLATIDYAEGAPMAIVNRCEDDPEQTLPPSNVVEFDLADDAKLIVRPSGTEPKIKGYLFAKGETRGEAAAVIDRLEDAACEILK